MKTECNDWSMAMFNGVNVTCGLLIAKAVMLERGFKGALDGHYTYGNGIVKSLFRLIVTAAVTVIVGAALAVPLPAQSIEFTADDIVAAIGVASDGYSTDEILIRDELRNRFVDHLATSLGRPLHRDEERVAVLAMLKLRKAGKLKSVATRRGPPADDSVAPIAEIAARVVGDRHRVSSDTLLADPTLRDELQSEAELLRPGIDAYAVRKSILGLRKKRALKPELVLQVADWDRTIETLTVQQLRDRLDQASVSSGPGVYLFRSGDGYLYV
ncbi:MAG: hypothetical protein WBD31_19615, partial [Rubripirellula sp.]